MAILPVAVNLSIADEVRQNLTESVGGSVERHGDVLRNRRGQREPFFQRLLVKDGCGFGQQLPQIVRDVLQHQAAGFDLRKIQDVIDGVQ